MRHNRSPERGRTCPIIGHRHGPMYVRKQSSDDEARSGIEIEMARTLVDGDRLEKPEPAGIARDYFLTKRFKPQSTCVMISNRRGAIAHHGTVAVGQVSSRPGGTAQCR